MDDQRMYDRFQNMYAAGTPPPWDSGIVPPEVRALIERESPLRPGRAVDIGCGTGTSSVYLAGHGWKVTGADWIAAAVERARERAAQHGLTDESLRFVQASITAPDFLPDHPAVDLWLDVGCLHGIDVAARPTYASHAQRLIAPGGTALIYSWMPHEREDSPPGFSPEDITALFGAEFTLVEAQIGREATNTSIPSAWYSLHRHGVAPVQPLSDAGFASCLRASSSTR